MSLESQDLLNTTDTNANLFNRYTYTIESKDFRDKVKQFSDSYGHKVANDEIEMVSQDLILNRLSKPAIMGLEINFKYLQNLVNNFLPLDFKDYLDANVMYSVSDWVPQQPQETLEHEEEVHEQVISLVEDVKLINSQHEFVSYLYGHSEVEVMEHFNIKNQDNYNKKLSRVVASIQAKLNKKYGIEFNQPKPLPAYIAPTTFNSTEQIRRWSNYHPVAPVIIYYKQQDIKLIPITPEEVQEQIKATKLANDKQQAEIKKAKLISIKRKKEQATKELNEYLTKHPEYMHNKGDAKDDQKLHA